MAIVSDVVLICIIAKNNSLRVNSRSKLFNSSLYSRRSSHSSDTSSFHSSIPNQFGTLTAFIFFIVNLAMLFTSTAYKRFNTNPNWCITTPTPLHFALLYRLLALAQISFCVDCNLFVCICMPLIY